MNEELVKVLDVMRARHSVRSYTDQPLAGEVLEALQAAARAASDEGDLRMQLCLGVPEAFVGGGAKYGSFSGARNIVALVGEKASDLDERCGYYGERLVLEAQRLGLGTCWIAHTYNKKTRGFTVGAGERCPSIIAIGYGTEQGKTHKVKPIEKLARVNGKPAAPEVLSAAPAWFRAGMEAAQLAPTAMNQQRFVFDLREGTRNSDGAHGNAVDGNVATAASKAVVSARALVGPCTKIDLGIAKYHFEVAANAVSSDWRWA